MKTPAFNQIRKFNVEKMRHQLARNTPDRVSRSFDRERMINGIDTPVYERWRDDWARMMSFKHKGKMEISLYEEFDNHYNTIVITLDCSKYVPSHSRDAYTANELRDRLGMPTK